MDALRTYNREVSRSCGSGRRRGWVRRARPRRGGTRGGGAGAWQGGEGSVSAGRGGSAGPSAPVGSRPWGRDLPAESGAPCVSDLCRTPRALRLMPPSRRTGRWVLAEGRGPGAGPAERSGGAALLPVHRGWRSSWSRSWSRACPPRAASLGCRASASCPGTAAAWTRSPAARACRRLPATLASLLQSRILSPWTQTLCSSPSSACATLCSAARLHRCWRRRPAWW